MPPLLANKGPKSKRTFLDDVILDQLKKGAPPVHEKLPNCGENSNQHLTHGHHHKDEFRKAKRLTTAG